MAECDRSVAPRRVVAGSRCCRPPLCGPTARTSKSAHSPGNGEQASGSGSESLGVRGLATRFLHVRESENEVHKVRTEGRSSVVCKPPSKHAHGAFVCLPRVATVASAA